MLTKSFSKVKLVIMIMKPVHHIQSLVHYITVLVDDGSRHEREHEQ